MSTISVNQFLKETIKWAKIRNDQFKYYWPVKGAGQSHLRFFLCFALVATDVEGKIVVHPSGPEAKTGIFMP